MPDKTQGELIRELLIAVTTLTQRVDHVETETQRLKNGIDNLKNQVTELDKTFALLHQHVTDLREATKEKVHRLWMIAGPILGAIIGALLGYILSR